MTNAVFAEDVDLEKELQEAESQDADAEAENEAEDTEQQAESADAEETQEEQKESPRVPLAELQAERKRRQEFQRQLEESQATYKKLEERLTEMAKRLEPQEETSFEDNPAEWLRKHAERTNQSVEELKQQFTQTHQMTEQQQQQQMLANRVIASENAFRKQTSDYDEAVDFLRSKRAEEYRVLGYDDPAQIQQMLTNEAFQLAQQAIEAGREPAELAYQIAKARGYTGKPKTDKLANVEKGQQRTKSLSNVGGQEERVPDLEALANMSDADFAKAVADGQWEKLLQNA